MQKMIVVWKTNVEHNKPVNRTYLFVGQTRQDKEKTALDFVRAAGSLN